MHTTPAPADRARSAVPPQERRPSGAARPADTDHPDPLGAAQAAALDNLLRCWVRETGLPAPDGDVLRIALPASGTALLVPVRYWSPTGLHHFGPPRLAGAPPSAPPLDAALLASLLAREGCAGVETGGAGVEGGAGPGAGGVAVGDGAGPGVGGAVVRGGSGLDVGGVTVGDGAGPDVEGAGVGAGARPGAGGAAVRDRVAPGAGDAPVGAGGGPEWVRSPRGGGVRLPSVPPPVGTGTDLVARVADSVRRVAVFLAERRKDPADPHPDLFLAAEQALLLGHPLHPDPKSREGLSDAEAEQYSPELRGSFPLHWLAVAPSLLATDSAWTERGRPVTAPRLTARLAGAGLPLPDGYAALPVHPWQLRHVRHRRETAALLDAGLLRDLGSRGAPWHPTSSVRTVHRTGAPAMLKLSLALRITNSRRENLRKELHRGVEVHRLLRTGLSQQWRAAHPGFDIVRDPAWVAVNAPDGDPVPGLDAVIRHNPFWPHDDVVCVAGLVSPRPRPGGGAMRSRLAEIITRLAARTGRPPGAVAAEWFLRYLEHAVRPVLWFDAAAGIALEAHQQNTLLLLDADGWPAGARYRDNQGYYFRASRRAELDARLPGIGEHSDTFVPDAVTDERFAYYLGVNNVLGLIGAFGSQGLADEALLLAAFRRFLTGVRAGPAGNRGTLPARLLDSPQLRCKANLLTRLHGLDELAGPVDTQSVYVTIANPLHS
ncbi:MULTISPECIES: IucA/IucC family protein [unclassified Streptomyces]|uniref:IucA/IucC family protein n=1 Tax=unclassified Streptomyces TaxID=2593676 RepID=UPI000AF796CA|nr:MULTISPECIES: IucA/IucC family protein [unclassified Streptomyces]AZM59669.1 iron transporter [Streptomyces sp. WAC 01438]RSM92094.1 iron transporter [Streptomyces sp. WAC 01420]